MAFNAEADFKALRMRVEGLERRIDSLEKTVRALPDLAAIAKLVPRLDAAEKAIALKKDAKTAEQEAAKYGATMAALGKEMASKTVLETRLKLIEAQVQTAMALAGAKR